MIPKICLFALISAIVVALLDSFGFKSARLVGILFGILLITTLISSLSEGISKLLSLSEIGGISDYARLALKAVGLGYTYSLCSEICQGLGEGLIAKGVCTAGRVHLFILALPYIEKIARLGVELLG